MASIFPVTATRVSELLVHRQVTSQIQFDRTELLRLESQLSTGYRLNLPSDDAPAAYRAVALQRLLEQKGQARSNLTTSESYVAATDSALANVSELIANVRAQSLAAVDTTTTEDQRAGISTEVRRVLETLLNVGNQEFRDRSLFAGSLSGVQPFETAGSYVVYRGNESKLSSFVDVGLLAETNMTGHEVFGALSPEVRGTSDLNPVLTLETRLSDLRNGMGIRAGSLVISDGTSKSTMDVEGLETVGDLVQRIESNPPEGRQLSVRISATGLTIDIDDAGGGNLTIKEAGVGTTAAELGILETSGTGVGPIVGDDLNPRLRSTTQLQDILGKRASGLLASAGDHNDIVIEAVANGSAMDGVNVSFVANAAAGDQALINFDPVGKTLEIDIRPGVTRARTVVNAINATGLFTASLDDKQDTGNDGSATLDVTATTVLQGGSGIVLDQSSGIQIQNKGTTYDITFDGAETIEDILNILNGSDADVLATINGNATGIDIRSRVSGADFSIGENGGTTATELGIRSFTTSTLLGDLNFGRGVDTISGDDLVIQRRDGVNLQVDLSSAVTVGDVLDLINTHPANVGNPVVASLAAFGNGIELVDANAAGASTLSVSRTNSFAAVELGFVPSGESQAAASPAGGASESILGRDVNSLETKSIYNTLIRLDKAVREFDLAEIQRTSSMLDDDFQRVTFARADLGTRARYLESVEYQLDNEEVDLRSALSDEIDVDMVEAISDLTLRQANLQATLQLVGQTMQLSLLNFI